MSRGDFVAVFIAQAVPCVAAVTGGDQSVAVSLRRHSESSVSRVSPSAVEVRHVYTKFVLAFPSAAPVSFHDFSTSNQNFASSLVETLSAYVRNEVQGFLSRQNVIASLNDSLAAAVTVYTQADAGGWKWSGCSL